MSSHAITLQLPTSLYDILRNRARRARLSVESEALNLMTTAVEEEGLPDDLAVAVESLELLDDDDLWRAARRVLTLDKQEQLEALNLKQQNEGLTRSERDAHATLLHAYDQAVLVRARAVELLAERGHDVGELLGSR